MPYAEVANKALEVEEAELRVIKAQEIRRYINMVRRNTSFGRGSQSEASGNKRKWQQNQGERQEPQKGQATGQHIQSTFTRGLFVLNVRKLLVESV